MSEKLSEFALNLPMVAVAGTANTAYDITASAEVPADVNPTACSHISIYVDSTSMANYDQNDPNAMVDLVMTVNITDPNSNQSKLYKLIKRLSFNKIKLACEAESGTPVQVIEDLDDPEEVKKQMADFFAAKRKESPACNPLLAKINNVPVHRIPDN